MLRSPDEHGTCHLRLAPGERALAEVMDGTRTVARLVAEFVRLSGQLAPAQVTRVVADLAANRIGPLRVRVVECQIHVQTTAGRATTVYRLVTTLVEHRQYPAFDLVRL